MRDDRPLIENIVPTERSREAEEVQRKTSHRSRSAETRSKREQRTPAPVAAVASTSSGKSSARDVFGSDSDDDGTVLPGNKKNLPICSYFSKRVSGGVSRQTDPNKGGSHYVELKVYNCNEIKHIAPMNRWRHAIISVKNRTDENTQAWAHLSEFIKATRREFKGCRPDVFNGC